jgi:hypothetical protein
VTRVRAQADGIAARVEDADVAQVGGIAVGPEGLEPVQGVRPVSDLGVGATRAFACASVGSAASSAMAAIS